MEVNLRIKRFNPEVDKRPHWETYTVDVDESDRVLDALHQVKWHQDGTLSFRRSCAHGVCGSDAMVINGKNRLACVLLVRDVGSEITIEPIRGLPVVKDLVVDMEPFFEGYKLGAAGRSSPTTSPATGSASSPPRSGPASTTPPSASCARPAPRRAPSTGPTTPTWGRRPSSTPTASSSTPATTPPTSASTSSAERTGVWGCRTAFNCTDACPRGIKVTQAIQEVKRVALAMTVTGATVELASVPPLNRRKPDFFKKSEGSAPRSDENGP